MKKFIIVLLMNLLFATIFVQAQDSASNCDKEIEVKNKALAKRFYEKVWFSDNPEVVKELFATEYVAHDIGDRKGITEPAEKQNEIVAFFWDNGKLSGSIDYQIAECDLVATRWQVKFEPTTWWVKLAGGRETIPIINVFRFKDGKIVEIWNHRHDIDTAQGNILAAKGFLVGLIPSLILLIVCFFLWRRLRKRKS